MMRYMISEARAGEQMIEIKSNAYKKIEEYSKDVHNGEIGGLLLGYLNDKAGIVVDDAVLLEQYKTASTFEITEDAMMTITKEWEADKLASVVGWWHSHCNYDVFWSFVDDKTFERMCNMSGFCFGIVVAFHKGKMEHKCRLRLTNKIGVQLDIDDVPVKIEESFSLMDSSFYKGIREEKQRLVHDDSRIWRTCPTCRGEGFVAEKRKKKKFFGLVDGDEDILEEEFTTSDDMEGIERY